MRQTALDMVYQLAKQDERVVFIGSDLGGGTLKKMKEEMPERFFMEGISEANIVGMAAGMALEGKIPYINTIATFLTRRCFEQVVLDLCLHHLNVRLLGSGGGLVYAPLGPTHLAVEDIAIMRALPHMTILAPADADEMRRLMLRTLDHQGPVYVRIAKGGEPIVTNDKIPFEIGRAFPMREGGDALIVTTGVTLKTALDAAEVLAAKGVQVAILHIPTIKPLDTRALLNNVARVPVVVAIEEHSVIGGLGSAVAEVIAEARFPQPKGFRRIGIPDTFPDQYGSQATLMARYNLTPATLVATIEELRKD